MPVFFQTPSYGGPGGAGFDDILATTTDPPVGFKAMAVRSGDWIDQLAPTYALASGHRTTLAHGGGGGTGGGFTFETNEALIGVQGYFGTYVNQLSFLTAVYYGSGDPPYQQTRSYGQPVGTPFTIWGEIAAFYGASGDYLDRVGCYLSTGTVGPFGGGGGSAWQDPGPVPELSRILRISVWAGTYINAIATTYLLPDNSTQTFTHGGQTGTQHDISFNPGEQIIVALGRSGSLVDNICFLTEDPQGVRRTYGPYGGQGGAQFICNQKVNGFFGRSGSMIDQIGFLVS